MEFLRDNLGTSVLARAVEQSSSRFPIQSRRMKFPQSIRVAIILLALPLLLSAEPVSQLRPSDYVNDFAHVLDQTTIAQLDNICQQLDQKAHAQIAVVTINTLDGTDIESYAVALYKQWGIGSKATDHGVLILLAVQDHKYRIEVGYGLEPILTDGKVGGFGREAVPLLRQNDYNGAVSLMTSRKPTLSPKSRHRIDRGTPAITARPGVRRNRIVAETVAHSRRHLLVFFYTPAPYSLLDYSFRAGRREAAVIEAVVAASARAAAVVADSAVAVQAAAVPAEAGSGS